MQPINKPNMESSIKESEVITTKDTTTKGPPNMESATEESEVTSTKEPTSFNIRLKFSLTVIVPSNQSVRLYIKHSFN